MDVAQLLIWFLFKFLKLKRCALSGSKSYFFLVEVEAFLSVQPPSEVLFLDDFDKSPLV